MYDTIIIGAGIAGLAAANYLKQNSNQKFLVLESFEKIGGRVRTIDFGNKLFSIGPGWIHGKKGNPIYDIFVELGVTLELCIDLDCSSLFVYDTEKGEEVTHLFSEKRKIINENMEKIKHKFCDQVIDLNQSYRDFLKEHSKIYDDISDIERTILYTYEIYFGAPFKEVSAFTEICNNTIFGTDEEIINYRITDPLGCLKCIDYLAFGLTDRIQLNCNVKTIEWSQDSDPVRITSSDGQQFLCKNVIITLQSGLLAQESITFKPQLPKEKLRALKHVPAVNYCRLFAKFPQKFWPNKEWLIPVIKNVDPVNELLLWQNCSSQNLCDEDDNILICHYTSGCENGSSRFDVEREKLIEMVGESMKNMFPLTYCEPTEVLFVSHWNSGRFAGSFSIAAPGIDEFMIEELQKNIGPLHFAGESVDIDLIGTMQAAYISGKNAAQKILQKETGFHQD